MRTLESKLIGRCAFDTSQGSRGIGSVSNFSGQSTMWSTDETSAQLKTFNLCDTGPLHGESAGRQTSRFSEQRVSYVEGPCYIT